MFDYYVWGTETNIHGEEILTVHATTTDRNEALHFLREERATDPTAKITVEMLVGSRRVFDGYAVFDWDDVFEYAIWVCNCATYKEAKECADAEREDGYGSYVEPKYKGVESNKIHTWPNDLNDLPF